VSLPSTRLIRDVIEGASTYVALQGTYIFGRK